MKLRTGKEGSMTADVWGVCDRTSKELIALLSTTILKLADNGLPETESLQVLAAVVGFIQPFYDANPENPGLDTHLGNLLYHLTGFLPPAILGDNFVPWDNDYIKGYVSLAEWRRDWAGNHGVQ